MEFKSADLGGGFFVFTNFDIFHDHFADSNYLLFSFGSFCWVKPRCVQLSDVERTVLIDAVDAVAESARHLFLWRVNCGWTLADVLVLVFYGEEIINSLDGTEWGHWHFLQVLFIKLQGILDIEIALVACYCCLRVAWVLRLVHRECVRRESCLFYHLPVQSERLIQFPHVIVSERLQMELDRNVQWLLI